MNKTKVFFWGTPDLAVPSLEALHNYEQVELVGVGVFPDRKIGRKQISTPCPVKKAAQKLNLPIYEISTKKDLVRIGKEVSFDLGIVIAFGMIFPKEVLNAPSLGIVNVHFSLLPLYRGASPVQSAILQGDKQSGITWQRMVLALDAGDILYKKKYSIENKSTSELFDFLGKETALHMGDFLKKYTAHEIIPELQQENQATFCGKFKKQDGRVCFQTDTAKEIHKKVLAFDIWPGVFIETKNGNIKIFNTSLFKKNKAIHVDCVNNTNLWIEDIQLPGKQRSKALDVVRNNPHIFRT